MSCSARIEVDICPALTREGCLAGGIDYRPTESTCGFVCPTSRTEYGNTDEEVLLEEESQGRHLEKRQTWFVQ